MRGLAQGNIAHNLEGETFKSSDLGGMVRQQLYTTESQVMKYLRAHSVVSIDSVSRFEARFPLGYGFFLHYSIGPQLVYEIEAVLALAQVKNQPPPGRK